MVEIEVGWPKTRRYVDECDGNGRDHCCWMGGFFEEARIECPWIERDTVEGRRWSCRLYREHQSWEDVYQDPRYHYSPVVRHTFFDREDYGPARYGCGDWPQRIPGLICNQVAELQSHIRGVCGCTFPANLEEIKRR